MRVTSALLMLLAASTTDVQSIRTTSHGKKLNLLNNIQNVVAHKDDYLAKKDELMEAAKTKIAASQAAIDAAYWTTTCQDPLVTESCALQNISGVTYATSSECPE